MKMNINKTKQTELKVGSIIITDKNTVYLITENELNPPCRCSEHMGEGYVLIRLDGEVPKAWSVFTELSHIEDDVNIIKIIEPENIEINEI